VADAGRVASFGGEIVPAVIVGIGYAEEKRGSLLHPGAPFVIAAFHRYGSSSNRKWRASLIKD